MMHRVAPLLLSILSVVAVIFIVSVAGCDKATPVAPDGSILVISANPTRIALNGTSTITVIGRKPDGQPLNPGTEIRFSATNGSIPSIVMTDSGGTATAIYQSNGTPGTATITAATGTGSGSGSGGTMTSGGTGTTSGSLTASVSIQVGLSAMTIIVQPTPTVIQSSGGNVQLLAIVRDSNGQPLAHQGVNFTTDVGTLDSRGATITTNAQGQAHDTLRVSTADLLNNTTMIHVTAQSATSAGALITGMATIQVVTGRPIAHFSWTPTADNHTVQFTNASSGGTGTLTYSWDFGDQTSSNEQNPVHTYTANQQFTVQLTVTDSTGQSSVSTGIFTIPLTMPGSSTP